MFRKLLPMSLVFLIAAFAAQAKAQPYLLAFGCQATTDSDYAGLQANLDNVDGCVHLINWSAIETSEGNYDFIDGLDNDPHFTPYIGKTCGGNLRAAHDCYIVPVIWLISDGGYNRSTPDYVYSSEWASDLGTTPLDYAWCGGYEGDMSGSGFGNSGDSTTFPAVWEKPFKVASENFIQKLISHLNSLTTGIGPQILYVRIGYTSGGEAFPFCETQLQSIAKVSDVQTLMANYYVPGYKAEAQFIKNQSPKKQMEMSVNCGSNLAWCPYNSLPESDELEKDALGIGNQGLQVGDGTAIQNGQETSNGWYADYTTYPNTHWREMQTLDQSCPTGAPSGDCTAKGLTTTGSLTDIFPIVSKYANLSSFEAYLGDILCTYDSSYQAPSGTPTYADCQKAGYRAAFSHYF